MCVIEWVWKPKRKVASSKRYRNVKHSSIFAATARKKKPFSRERQAKLTTRFRHRPETSHLDCARLFAGDKGYADEVVSQRVVMISHGELDMNCEAIRLRVLTYSHQPVTN
ncbi:hypothetical protein KIN20_031032 [Parelaphostrongylus tenuis]|nr:hypothetical protein KIN20_031028 [Parelaphostrongylus tenuis]KAJ1369547.1 hypothetical protein KIN20_031032 [Parelaphostrongylus tenuis]